MVSPYTLVPKLVVRHVPDQCAPQRDIRNTRDVSCDQLRDKMNGGIIGQFFGNLNGLQHENKYFEEPGNVTEYTPDLSDGAFTDDDTDIEFVHIYTMAKTGEIILPYQQIRDLWIENISEYIWCSNRYARNMMEIGFEPPNTGRIAFNFGWDADNISAMVGTMVGVIKGEKWIRSQGWEMKDEYRNTRRPELPTDLTISAFADLHYNMAKRIILENGGKEIEMRRIPGYKIVLEVPKNIEPLPDSIQHIREMRDEWWPMIQKHLSGNSTEKACAVYAAICLDLVPNLVAKRSKDWFSALDSFEPYYDSLFGDDQWTVEAKHYFHEVVYNKNGHPDCPFGYVEFTDNSR
ncbi:ADP-ribosylglycohydrolase family protein [candidate division KSB1 bacterium]|nr:ADP-ribosylglycohydrolase family protein [candidate division KSB1 bacterium]